MADVVGFSLVSAVPAFNGVESAADEFGMSREPLRGIFSLGVGVKVAVRELIDQLEGEACSQSRKAELGRMGLCVPGTSSSSVSSSSSGEPRAILTALAQAV